MWRRRGIRESEGRVGKESVHALRGVLRLIEADKLQHVFPLFSFTSTHTRAHTRASVETARQFFAYSL